MTGEAFGVTTETTAAEVGGAIRSFVERQVPFATAKALTRTAERSRKSFQRGLARRFKTRNKSFAPDAPPRTGVVTFVRAEKSDWPHSFAIIGTKKKSDFLVLQETGGRKKPQRGAKRLAIPIIANIKRTSGGKIRNPQKPRAIREHARGYASNDLVLKRTGKGKRSRAKAFFILRRRARIRPVLKMERDVGRFVGKTYGEIFRWALVAAMKTARDNPITTPGSTSASRNQYRQAIRKMTRR